MLDRTIHTRYHPPPSQTKKNKGMCQNRGPMTNVGVAAFHFKTQEQPKTNYSWHLFTAQFLFWRSLAKAPILLGEVDLAMPQRDHKGLASSRYSGRIFSYSNLKYGVRSTLY